MTPAWSSSRIGRLRIKALSIIEQYQENPASVGPGQVMVLVALQDQITQLKHRNLLHTSKVSDFAWVDSWTPH